MKRRIRPLFAFGLSLLPLVPLASAALDTKIIGADAQWLMHLDFDSLRESAVGREIVTQVEAMQSEANPSALQLNIPRVLQLVGSVTAYGANLSQNPELVDGALVLQGKPELRKIAEGFAVQQALTSPDKFAAITDLPFDAYSVGGELIIGFPPEPIILLSKSREQLLNARLVFQGKAKSLAKASDSPLRGLVRNQTGGFVLAASVVPSENFFPADAPQARILQMTKSASLEVGESDDKTFAHVQLLASSDEMADKLMKILDGITAMVSLAESNDRALADFLQSVTVKRTGTMVTLHLAYASERLVQMFHDLQKAGGRRNDGRWEDGGVVRDVVDGPVPPVEQPVLVSWVADQDLGDIGVSARTLVSRTVPGVALVPGSTLVLTGHREGGENARFDYVEITPAAGGQARRVEAEEMSLVNYTRLPNRHASGGNVIQLHDPSGTARWVFDGSAGDYTLTVRYVDETDGRSTFFVSVLAAAPAVPAATPGAEVER